MHKTHLEPSVPILFANQVGTMNLLIIAGIILLIPVPLISWLEKIQFSELKNHKVNLDETKNTIKKDFLSGFSSLIYPFLSIIPFPSLLIRHPYQFLYRENNY